MSTVRKPFVLRVQNDDPNIARAIAHALVGPLTQRDMRVRVDGQLRSHGASGIVQILNVSRGIAGTSLTVGTYDEVEGARWLAPIETSDQPDAALPVILAFLETWGFIPAGPPAHVARPKSAS